jgi:glycosyltransferase involved in cell wall biosynthesis
MKFCFIAPTSADLVLNNGSDRVGGAEIQQYRIAIELQRQGHVASFLVNDIGQPERVVTEIGEVWRLSVPNKKTRMKGAGTFNRWQNLLSLMSRVNADVYYYRMPFLDILPSALWCRYHRKQLIYSNAADSTVEGISSFKGTRLIKLMTLIGIRLAYLRLCQHTEQQERMLRNLGLTSVVIPNGVEVPSMEIVNTSRAQYEGRNILFLGAVTEHKHPELFIKLSELCSDYSFVMCGGKRNIVEWNQIRECTKNHRNLEFIPGVPPTEVPNLLARSSLLVNTSFQEGFPNAFLEAWCWMVPVVTLHVDPGGIMKQYGLGEPSGTINLLAARVKHLMSDNIARQELGLRGRKYVEEHHSIEKVVRRFVSMAKNSKGLKRCAE